MSQPYLSLEAELHDAFWDAEDNGSEIRTMADFLESHPGRALEIGSGSGRLMFPLVKDGFNVEGLEISPDMLALGEIRARVLGVKPIVHCGDMTIWQPAECYRSLLAPAFTLQLAEDPAAVLQHWCGMLEHGGGLYLTVFIPYAELLGDLPENEWYLDHKTTLQDGHEGILQTRHSLDRDKQLLHREHRYSLSGETPLSYQSRQTIRWIEHQEMLNLLNECGFEMDRFIVDFDPDRHVADPDRIDFDGILTYHATRRLRKS